MRSDCTPPWQEQVLTLTNASNKCLLVSGPIIRDTTTRRLALDLTSRLQHTREVSSRSLRIRGDGLKHLSLEHISRQKYTLENSSRQLARAHSSRRLHTGEYSSRLPCPSERSSSLVTRDPVISRYQNKSRCCSWLWLTFVLYTLLCSGHCTYAGDISSSIKINASELRRPSDGVESEDLFHNNPVAGVVSDPLTNISAATLHDSVLHNVPLNTAPVTALLHEYKHTWHDKLNSIVNQKSKDDTNILHDHLQIVTSRNTIIGNRNLATFNSNDTLLDDKLIFKLDVADSNDSDYLPNGHRVRRSAGSQGATSGELDAPHEYDASHEYNMNDQRRTQSEGRGAREVNWGAFGIVVNVVFDRLENNLKFKIKLSKGKAKYLGNKNVENIGSLLNKRNKSKKMGAKFSGRMISSDTSFFINGVLHNLIIRHEDCVYLPTVRVKFFIYCLCNCQCKDPVLYVINKKMFALHSTDRHLHKFFFLFSRILQYAEFEQIFENVLEHSVEFSCSNISPAYKACSPKHGHLYISAENASNIKNLFCFINTSNARILDACETPPLLLPNIVCTKFRRYLVILRRIIPRALANNEQISVVGRAVNLSLKQHFTDTRSDALHNFTCLHRFLTEQNFLLWIFSFAVPQPIPNTLNPHISKNVSPRNLPYWHHIHSDASVPSTVALDDSVPTSSPAEKLDRPPIPGRNPFIPGRNPFARRLLAGRIHSNKIADDFLGRGKCLH